MLLHVLRTVEVLWRLQKRPYLHKEVSQRLLHLFGNFEDSQTCSQSLPLSCNEGRQSSALRTEDRPSSSACSQPTSRRVREENNRSEDFNAFLTNLLEEVRKPEDENSWDAFFKSLSVLVKSLNLSPVNSLDLQSKILIFVKKELEKYNDT